MPFTPLDLLLAWFLDVVVGDPRWIPWPHPVVLMGRAAAALEAGLRREHDSPLAAVCKGIVLWTVVVGTALLAGWGLLLAAHAAHPWLGQGASVYIAYSCLATRDLDAEARKVGSLLRMGRLTEARTRLARIVGRDTDGLAPPEIARGTVETVAENTSDAVVAPLFFLAVGGLLGWGPVLGLMYKAVNTLDSAVGYRTRRYEHFGKFSARLDDAANWLPARLTAALTAVAAHLLWGRGGPAARMALRDGKLHKSPNSGFPEAAFAGALGVELGGTNTYGGIPRTTPSIGDPGPPLEPEHVSRSRALLWTVSALSAGLAAAVLWV